MGTENEPIEENSSIEAPSCNECERRKNYIIHLLHKQAVVLGLNEQDIGWLKEFGIEVECG